MSKPTEDLVIWATQDVDLTNIGGPNKVKPINDLINKGWDCWQKPAAEELNYVLNNLAKYVNWLATDVADTSTSLNIPNTIVKRDVDGNFAAGEISANCATATKLKETKTINGTAFDGSSNITTNSWGTARTLTFGGSSFGSVSVDGSENETITLNHTQTLFTGTSDSVVIALSGNVALADSAVYKIYIADGTVFATSELARDFIKSFTTGTLNIDYGDSTDFIISWTYVAGTETLTLTNTNRGDIVRVYAVS